MSSGSTPCRPLRTSSPTFAEGPQGRLPPAGVDFYLVENVGRRGCSTPSCRCFNPGPRRMTHSAPAPDSSTKRRRPLASERPPAVETAPLRPARPPSATLLRRRLREGSSTDAMLFGRGRPRPARPRARNRATWKTIRQGPLIPSPAAFPPKCSGWHSARCGPGPAQDPNGIDPNQMLGIFQEESSSLALLFPEIHGRRHDIRPERLRRPPQAQHGVLWTSSGHAARMTDRGGDGDQVPRVTLPPAA